MIRGTGILTTEWKLPPVLTAPVIEDWAASLSANTKRVAVRLGSWRQTGPFADARLQGALCLLHRRNIETIAIVPPVTLQGDRAPRAFADPNPLRPRGALTPTELNLTNSVAGLAIGQLCDFDRAHGNIATLQRQTVTRRRHLFGWGDEAALVVPTDGKPTGVPRKPLFVRQAIFNNRLEDLLQPLAISARHARTAIVQWFPQLRTFAFEASENTWDHGRLDFNSRPIRSIRFVRLRRIDIGRWGFDVKKIAPGFEEPFRNYIDSLAAAQDLPNRWHPDGGRLIEVTVADGGVGIAAKMAAGFDVFQGPIEVETRHLLGALNLDGTTKGSGQHGRGQGFRKMLQACFRVSGLIIVRTGRLRVSRTYKRPDGSNEVVDFGEPSSDAYIPRIDRSALPLLAGTSISLIFPIEGVRDTGPSTRS